jgi:hypothetical protein
MRTKTKAATKQSRPINRKAAHKTTSKTAPKTSARAATRAAPKVTSKITTKGVAKPAPKIVPKFVPLLDAKPAFKEITRSKMKVRHAHVRAVVRAATPLSLAERRALRAGRLVQFAYMKAPGVEHAFDVGDTVEVFCDHEKNSDRIRGWIKGIVVQTDNKLVAVQFRSNVYLTDGWMVPDRILWYPLLSDQIRPSGTQKKLGNKEILEY